MHHIIINGKITIALPLILNKWGYVAHFHLGMTLCMAVSFHSTLQGHKNALIVQCCGSPGPGLKTTGLAHSTAGFLNSSP